MRNTFVSVLTTSLIASVSQAQTADAPGGPTEPAAAPAPLLAPVTAGAEEGSHDESIYIVQRRGYSKSGELELTPLFFTSLNNKFVGHFGLGFSAAYHLRENIALELTTTVPYAMKQFFSALVFEVYDLESLTPEAVDLKQMDYYGGLSAQFSALYGKVDFYGWLIDYDFYVAPGFGVASTLETCVPDRDDCSGDVGIGRGVHSPSDSGDRYKLTAMISLGMRFFFSDYLGLRLEVRDVVFSDSAVEANEVTTDIRNNWLFSLGLTFLI